MKINLSYKKWGFMAAVSDSLVITKYDWLNEFKVHFFIMQNAGYKHLGSSHYILSTYFITSRTFAKIKK